MTFGLKNTTEKFRREIDLIIASVKCKFALVYLVDVVFFSNTVDKHLEHLKAVLTLLKNEGVPLELKKYFFFHNKIEYLRHVIS